jgi:predicted MFS family arabinose efflux permease
MPQTTHLSRGMVGLMAAASGITVANIYYNQPLLSVFSGYFHVAAWKSGLVATAAQVGYGLGLLFFVPLGDLLERRKLIVFLINSCAICLLAAALAPNLPFLIVAQLLVGLTAISAQVLIPLGVEMTAPEERGRLIGAIMSGVLCGILLGRVVSGIISDLFGWRAVYFVATAGMLALGFILGSRLPHRLPVVSMSYPRLMHSMLELVETQTALWSPSLVSALSFAGFSAFWTTLSFFLAEHFHLGASAAGLFGIIGLVGAAGAPWAGRLSDRKGFGFTITLSLLLSAIAFAAMWIWGTIAGLVIGVLLMDLGVQAIQVAAQSSVISLLPEARSRVNTLYMVARFGGGAAGSALGAFAWSTARWPGVCGFCLGMTLLALAIHFAGRPRRPENPERVVE